MCNDFSDGPMEKMSRYKQIYKYFIYLEEICTKTSAISTTSIFRQNSNKLIDIYSYASSCKFLHRIFIAAFRSLRSREIKPTRTRVRTSEPFERAAVLIIKFVHKKHHYSNSIRLQNPRLSFKIIKQRIALFAAGLIRRQFFINVIDWRNGNGFIVCLL